MIAVEHLSFVYRKSKRAVLHDFSLSLKQGRVYDCLVKMVRVNPHFSI